MLKEIIWILSRRVSKPAWACGKCLVVTRRGTASAWFTFPARHWSSPDFQSSNFLFTFGYRVFSFSIAIFSNFLYPPDTDLLRTSCWPAARHLERLARSSRSSRSQAASPHSATRYTMAKSRPRRISKPMLPRWPMLLGESKIAIHWYPRGLQTKRSLLKSPKDASRLLKPWRQGRSKLPNYARKEVFRRRFTAHSWRQGTRARLNSWRNLCKLTKR